MKTENGKESFSVGLNLENLSRDVDKANKEFSRVGVAAEEQGKRIDDAFSKLSKGLIDSFERLAQSVDKNTRAQELSAQATRRATAAEKDGADKATRAIEDTGKATDSLSRKMKQAGDEGTESFGRLTKAAAGYFTLSAAKGFAEKVFNARKEIENLETSFRVLVGNQEKADQLFKSIKEFATSTPMQMQDLASAAQTMMGFGLPLEQIMENLKAIGDISMGDTQKFKSLALAFSQASAAGKLTGQDLMQMINAGFNPLATMAEKTGKTISQLKDEMSEGKISADMLRQSIIDATSEGGKFNGMLEQMSKTVGGAFSNLEGAINDALNGIGEQTEGIMMGVINAATVIVQYYEEIGKAILLLIATYGEYKAALMANIALEKAQAISRLSHIKGVTALQLVTDVLKTKTQQLNAVLMKNPYVMLATAVMSAATAIALFAKRSDEAVESQKELDKAFSDTQAQIATEQKNVDELFEKLRKAEKGTNEYKNIKNEIINQYGAYLKGLNNEIATLNDVEGAYKRVTEAIRNTALARGRDVALQRANENYNEAYSEYIGKIYDAVKEQKGEENAKLALKSIQADLKRTGAVAEDTQRTINKVTNGKVKFSWFGELNKAEQNLIDSQKRVAAMFGEQTESIIGSTEQAAESLSTSYSNAEKAYRNAQKWKATIEANREDYTKEEYEEAVKDVEARKKAFKDLGGDIDDKKSKAVNAAARKAMNEDAQQRQKLFEIQMAAEERQAKVRRQLEDSITDALVAGIDSDAEREREERRVQYERSVRQIQDQADDWKKESFKAAQQRFEATNTNKSLVFADTAEGKAGWQAQKLDKERQTIIDEQTKAVTEAYNREVEKRIRNEERANAEAVNAYLRQYGDYAQKKQAIYAEANDKICELEEQLSRATTDEARAAAKARIDTVKAETQEQVESLDEQYGKTKQFMIELFEDASEKSVREIDKIIKKYEALNEYLKGNSNVSRETLKVDFGFTDAEIDKSVRKLNEGDIALKDFTDAIKELKGELRERSPWQTFQSSIQKSVEKIKNAKGDISQIGVGLEGIGQAVNDFSPQVKQFSSDLSNIFGFDDSKVQAAIDGLDGLATSASGVGQIMSGDVIGGVMTTVNGISKIVSALDGAFGADYTEYNKAKERYEMLSSVWDELIGKKREYLSQSWGSEAQQATDEILELLKAEKELNRITAEERLGAGASAGSHSMRYRMWQGSYDYEGMNWRDVAPEISKALNVSFDKMDDLLDMSSDELTWIKTNYTGLWQAMDTDYREMLEKTIEFGRTEEDIMRQLKEQITGTTFNNVFDGFMNSLYDLADGSEDVFDDVADNWQKMMNKMVLNNLVGNKFKQQLEAWYEQWNAAYTGDSRIDEDEIGRLRSSYNSLLKSAADEVEELRRQGIVSAISDSSQLDQSQTKKGFATASQDSIDELNGRFAALVMIGEQSKEALTTSAADIAVLRALESEHVSISQEIRNLNVLMVSHLEDISKHTKRLIRIDDNVQYFKDKF